MGNCFVLFDVSMEISPRQLSVTYNKVDSPWAGNSRLPTGKAASVTAPTVHEVCLKSVQFVFTMICSM